MGYVTPSTTTGDVMEFYILTLSLLSILIGALVALGVVE